MLHTPSAITHFKLFIVLFSNVFCCKKFLNSFRKPSSIKEFNFINFSAKTAPSVLDLFSSIGPFSETFTAIMIHVIVNFHFTDDMHHWSERISSEHGPVKSVLLTSQPHVYYFPKLRQHCYVITCTLPMAERSLCFYVIILLLHVQALEAQNPLDCDFEEGFCEWSIGPNSDRNWTRSRVKSATPDTGPSTGHTLDTINYYIYLHARDFQDENRLVQPGMSCILECQEFNTGPKGGCFQFWYHMNGVGIGSLSFVLRQGTTFSSEFEKNGTQGPNWNCGTFPIAPNLTNLRIQVTAKTGANVKGDIALDDFQFYYQQCNQISDICNTDYTTAGTAKVTSQSISSSTIPGIATDLSGTTSTTPTTTETAPDDSWIIYVAIVPIVICVFGALIAYCVFKKRKKPKAHEPYDVADTPHTPVVEDEPEEYAELNEMNMDEIIDNEGYHLPSNDGFENNNINHLKAPVKGSPKYLKMSTTKNEIRIKGDDSSSVDSNYVEAMQSPIQNKSLTTGGNNRDSSRTNDGFHADELDPGLRTGTPKRGSTGKPFTGFDPELGRRQVGMRESLTPDYDEGNTHPPPPSCGQRTSYIRPIYEN